MFSRISLMVFGLLVVLAGVVGAADLVAQVDFEAGIPADWECSERVVIRQEAGNAVLVADYLDGLTKFGPTLEPDSFRLQFRVKVESFRGIVSRFQLVFPQVGDDGMVYLLSISRDTLRFGPTTDPGQEPEILAQAPYNIAQNRWVDLEVSLSQGRMELFIDGTARLSAELDTDISGFYFWSWTTVFAIDDLKISLP